MVLHRAHLLFLAALSCFCSFSKETTAVRSADSLHHAAVISASSHAAKPGLRPSLRTIVRSRQAVAARPAQAASMSRCDHDSRLEQSWRKLHSAVLDVRNDLVLDVERLKKLPAGERRHSVGERLVSRVEQLEVCSAVDGSVLSALGSSANVHGRRRHVSDRSARV